jgi:hypothetical protein
VTLYDHTARLVTEKQAEELLSALIKPLPGHTDEEVILALNELGASQVKPLGAGFISVNAHRSILDAIGRLAAVEIKPLQQFRLS